jgi:glyoxylase-like metal-dependent hydrolase (beta-lactamase superfamily II)
LSATVPLSLPPQVHVFVRDWLSSNNVLLKSAAGHVLVDTGYTTHVPLTLALLASRQGLDGDPLALVVNTHCHSDHIGGNAAVTRAYGCPIAIPAGELRAVEAWDTKALLLDYAGQFADQFAVGQVLEPGSTHVWGDLEWQALAAPGHDMGALVFFNAEHRILISGDALWENGFGFVVPPEIDPAAMPATLATLDMLAALDARVVIPGHGEPFGNVAEALERAQRRAAAFAADSQRTAWHGLKVVLAFCLLDRRRMPLAGLPHFMAHTGLFRDFNARFFGLSPDALATRLADDLVRAGAARRDATDLVAA